MKISLPSTALFPENTISFETEDIDKSEFANIAPPFPSALFSTKLESVILTVAKLPALSSIAL